MEHTMKSSKISSKSMARIGFLAVIGLVLELINFPFILPFLKLDLSSLPSIIAGISLGPFGAILTEVVKNLLKVVIQTETLGIGELSNLICGIAISVPISIVYRKRPNPKGYILGAVLGVLSLVVIASLSNYFFVMPAYAQVFGGMDAIINMCRSANGNMEDLLSVIVLGIVPFNLVKGTLAVVCGFFLHKSLAPVLN